MFLFITMTFEVSQDLLASLKIGIQYLAQEIRLMAAITWFQEKKLSLGKAADLAGCNRLNFMDLLTRKGIVIFDYDESLSYQKELHDYLQCYPVNCLCLNP